MSITNQGQLYVVLFSSGLIKVGRGSVASKRIADHARRLSCVGITVKNSRIVECAGDMCAAEATLIAKCVAAAKVRHKSEWFEGLDFDEVVGWAVESSTSANVRDEAKGKTAKVSHANCILVAYGDFIKERAKRCVALAIEFSSMSERSRDVVFQNLSRRDQFLVSDVICYANDICDAGIPVEFLVGALECHAIEIAFIQANVADASEFTTGTSDSDVATIGHWFHSSQECSEWYEGDASFRHRFVLVPRTREVTEA